MTYLLQARSFYFFAISFFFNLFWLSGLWPGIVQGDSLTFIQASRNGWLHDWLSFSMGFMTMIADMFPNPVGAVSLFFILLFSFVFMFFSQLLQTLYKNNTMIYVYLSIILFNPLILNMTVFYSRETVFAILNVFLFLSLFFWRYLDSRISNSNFFVWIFSLGLLTELRQDAKMLIVLYPLIALVFKVFDKKQFFLAMAGALALNVIILFFGSFFSQRSPMQTAYYLTATFPVIVAYESQSDIQRLNDEELADLRTIINFDPLELKKAKDQYSYLLSRINLTSDPSLKQYNQQIFKLLIKDPIGFFNYRVHFFIKTLSLGDEYTEWFSDYFRRTDENWRRPELVALGLKHEPYWPQLNSIQNWISDHVIYSGYVKKMLFGNLVTLILCLLIIAGYSYMPLSASISGLFLIKFIIVFWVAPISFANYFYYCYLGMFFLIPLAYFEFKLNVSKNLSNQLSQKICRQL